MPRLERGILPVVRETEELLGLGLNPLHRLQVTNSGEAENRRGSAAAFGTQRRQFAEVLPLARAVGYPAVRAEAEWRRQKDHGNPVWSFGAILEEGMGNRTLVPAISSDSGCPMESLLPLIGQPFQFD